MILKAKRLIKSFVIFSLLSLCSCGLQVVHKIREDDISYIEELASIRIKKDRNAESQELKNNLYDLFGTDSKKGEVKYLLILKINKNVTPTFYTATGASGRNMVNLIIEYELMNMNDGELISKSTTSVNDSYDISVNRYASYTAEEFVINNLLKTAARNIRNSVVNDITELKKKEEFSEPNQDK